ncbi:MAG: helix-turn-helix domain-containing protein [Christensenellales bacterium]|jgi:excisionase family DNA binding protein
MNKDAMNVDELATRLGISRPKAYDLVKQRDFPAITLGKRIIIPVSAFQEWLKNQALKKN